MEGAPTEAEDDEDGDSADAVAPGDGGLAPGLRVGRFTIVEALGTGGMGVVVAAHDPQLDRKVALKLVRGDALRARSRERLLREGQAMARLSHPNVLTVHEVGVVGDDVFLVMELVEGKTLRARLAEGETSWREVLALYLAAGRGLAAAHAAGLVHRDFKPDNVLVGDDGRVRVMDFGLVAAGEDEPAAAAGGTALSTDLTRTGAVMGTPLYMSPEQHRGEAVDARADQWAFCVALYEGLWGRAPFAGETGEDVRAEVLEGRVREPDGRVPGALRRIVMRGLEREPAARHASMTVLLDELAAVPVRRRRLAMGAGGVAVAGAVAAAFFVARPAAATPCRDSARHLAGTWDDGARERVRAAFARNGAHGADTATRVIAALDTYAGRWVDAHIESCKATAVHREQSNAALDLRMACLDRRLAEAGALARVFEKDGTAVEDAVGAVARLAAPDSCDDVQRLALIAPLPANADRAAVAAIEADLAEARALQVAGRYSEARTRSEEAAVAAKAAGFRALEAEAVFRNAQALDELDEPASVDRLFAAALAAEAAGDDATNADAWTLLANQSSQLFQLDDAERWLAIADAAVTRLGDEHRRDVLLGVRAQLRENQSRYEDSLADLREALAIHERHGGDAYGAAVHRYNLAATLVQLGRSEEGLVEADAAITIWERELGAQHPRVSAALEVRGLALSRLGRFPESLAAQERALAIVEAVLDHDSVAVLDTRSNLVNRLHESGKYDEALKFGMQSVADHERIFGPDHVTLATPLTNLGFVYLAMGRGAEALEANQRALRVLEKNLGLEHRDVAVALNGIGVVLQSTGRAEEALEPLRRSVAIMEKVHGADHPQTIDYMGNLGAALRRTGHEDEARGVLERCLTLLEKQLGPDHPNLTWYHGELGSVNRQHDPEAALRHYQRAIAIHEKVQPDHPNLAISLMRTGSFLLELKRYEEARTMLRRGLELADKVTRDPQVLGNMRWYLGWAEWETGHRDEARKLVKESRKVYADAGLQADVAESDAWLATHR